jgi:formylmethanofuran dehydrogenase subunit B
MTESPTTPTAASAPWTCPFCPLLCDAFQPRASASGRGLELVGSDCPRAHGALSHFGLAPSRAVPRLDGQECTLDAAIDAAARVLSASRQPLFGGLATDVAGARALYRLACATGAVSDAGSGAVMMHGLRALQDRGQYTTTLAEIRTRADLIVCLGSPTARHPEFFRRCGIGEDLVESRHVVCLDAPVDAWVAHAPRTTSESLSLDGDWHEAASLLAALVAQRAVRDAPPALAALAKRLLAARYAVIAWDATSLPAHGDLVVEALGRVVTTLNLTTRAAAFPLAGAEGPSTVNQVYAWLSGLPLRSRAGPLGLEHEPLAYDAMRMLAEGATDTLLWVSSYTPQALTFPGPQTPRIVLGHPDTVVPASNRPTVFIPVSTPGIGSEGHLFRTDGVVVAPLHRLYADTLPTVAEVASRLLGKLQGARAPGAEPKSEEHA